MLIGIQQNQKSLGQSKAAFTGEILWNWVYWSRQSIQFCIISATHWFTYQVIHLLSEHELSAHNNGAQDPNDELDGLDHKESDRKDGRF